MPKRPLTPAYIIFWILFSPDTWRLLMGFVLAILLAPAIGRSQQMGPGGTVLLGVMLTTIGWAVSDLPGRRMAEFCKRAILKGRYRL